MNRNGVETIELFVGLLVAVVVLVRIGRLLNLPTPIPLVVVGVLLSLAPGLSDVRLDPDSCSRSSSRRFCTTRLGRPRGVTCAVTPDPSACSRSVSS